jgi:hypothetical protein
MLCCTSLRSKLSRMYLFARGHELGARRPGAMIAAMIRARNSRWPDCKCRSAGVCCAVGVAERCARRAGRWSLAVAVLSNCCSRIVDFVHRRIGLFLSSQPASKAGGQNMGWSNQPPTDAPGPPDTQPIHSLLAISATYQQVEQLRAVSSRSFVPLSRQHRESVLCS